jgi:transcriptional regulator with XRE-family HTH domain
MDDQRFGATIRAIRIRRRLRQEDLAQLAGVSRATVSRLERGHLDTVSLASIRAVAKALDVRVDLMPRWRGGDLDRLLNARHSALHEQVARSFARLPGWLAEPEVSFAIHGERGIIDILAWHSARRALLVIELKTEIADVNELVGTIDRKRRLADKVARERGWDVGAGVTTSATTSVWVIVAPGARTAGASIPTRRCSGPHFRSTGGRSADGCATLLAASVVSASGQMLKGRTLGTAWCRSGGSRGLPACRPVHGRHVPRRSDARRKVVIVPNVPWV